ncbi:MAG: RNA-binding domain-containing protein [Candidatus Altiarchaeota archaeon]
MKAHHITVSVFAARQDVPKLSETLEAILPKDAAIDERAIEPETEGGVFMMELVELKSQLTRQKEVEEFATTLFKRLDDYDRRKILDNLESFVDDDCKLYIRLSKTEAKAGNIVLEYKDPIHVTVKLAAYPAKKENAVESARKMIEDALH